MLDNCQIRLESHLKFRYETRMLCSWKSDYKYYLNLMMIECLPSVVNIGKFATHANECQTGRIRSYSGTYT